MAMTTQARRDARIEIAFVCGCMLAGAAYTLATGEDANWDWQNYHEYNVWAWLAGRYAHDVAPAGFQTYFNPLIYFPVYWLRHLLPPPIGLTLIGAFHGLNLVLIAWITRRICGDRLPLLASAVIIAATGAMTVSEVGTSFADVVLSLLIIGGLGILLLAEGRNARVFLAGLMLGAAIGLKLTNAVFALGAIVAVLLGASPISSLVWLGIGGALGSTLTHGAWSVMLWREFGNPIFPLFNGLFESAETTLTNTLDRQFIPKDWLDALAYPFYWLAGIPRSSEFPFRDARFAVVMVLIPLTVISRAVQARPLFTRRDIQFFAFVAVSYATWLGLFAIHRYIVALELLCGPLIVVLIDRAWPAALHMRTKSAVMLGLALAIALWTQPGDWWRRPWSSPYRPAILAELAQPGLYFFLDKPFGYIAPKLAAGSLFYQLADIALPILPGSRFDARVRAGVTTTPARDMWAVTTRGAPARYHLLTRYGIERDDTKPCVTIEGDQLGTTLDICPLTRGR